ncbi:MAG: S8 family serine peptidase [Paludibacteraceae bacterium]
MKKTALFLIFILSQLTGNAVGYYFYVQLSDKNNSPYSLSNPSEYLSARAIERRAYYNVPIDSTDLPVNPQYISAIESNGLYIHCTTKWLNGITVITNDSSSITPISNLPFVQSVQFTGRTHEHPLALTSPSKVRNTYYDYGVAFDQINQLNGRILHENGYLGENIHIAVLDAGFYGADTNPAFQLMRQDGRLLGTKDFVNPASNIFAEDGHGALVLSSLATEMNGTHVGTAPKASYLLIRTEAAIGEYLCEPDFWISGIEYADSAGVDLATTSLGYTTFDDPGMDYSYNDLDGNTARASIAANIAYSKGILVLNSAGNEGNKSWHYINVPADAQGVITVGAVARDSIASSFSSFGATPDGRVKPELCAIGSSSALVASSGSTIYTNGTSFSCPILAGMTACFLQAAKVKMQGHSLDELRTLMFQSGHLYQTPTTQMGYGIPNFQTAYDHLDITSLADVKTANNPKILKIFIHGYLPIKVPLNLEKSLNTRSVNVYSITGQLCSTLQVERNSVSIDPYDFQKGVYVLKVMD